MKDFILKKTSVTLQNLAITIYNTWLYKQRHSGKYQELFDFYYNFDETNLSKIQTEQKKRLNNFLEFSCKNSKWYSKHSGKKFTDFPVLEKKEIITNLKQIATTSEKKGSVSLTGGTTGSSMKVIYTLEDKQERFAILDSFRFRHGYTLGEKVAWFSGKGIVRDKDIKKGNCFRDDWINNIRFFSTFHITDKNFDIYWKALEDFSPLFIVGFPSSVFDICVMAKERGLKLKKPVKVFFPTAESILPIHIEVIQDILGCQVINQYASSEGAPFILECHCGNLHINSLTGVFEVVDKKGFDSDEGSILITSFTTHGTPLIRYNIGDSIKLRSDKYECPCGSKFPLVEYIDGRTSDYVWSNERGRVNLGNLSNCTKGVNGVVKFQIIQDSPSLINVKMVTNNNYYPSDKALFEKNLRQRIGNEITINLQSVDDIPREKSGKFRLVKNSLAAT